jgi:ketosteroid isomerase-like protein
MKTKYFILSAFIIFFTISCEKKTVVNSDKLLADSLAAVAADAFNSGDVSKALNTYASDAVFLNGTAKMSNIDTIANAFKYMFQHSKNFKYYPCLSSVTKELVFIEGMFTFEWHMDNNMSIGKGSMIVIFKKQADKKWKITYCEENHGDIVKN